MTKKKDFIHPQSDQQPLYLHRGRWMVMGVHIISRELIKQTENLLSGGVTEMITNEVSQ